MLIEELASCRRPLLPYASPDLDRLFDKKHPDRIRVPLGEPVGSSRRLNASGWFDDEVLGGGLMTQGKAQSLPSMMLGWALLGLAKRTRRKSLPRRVLPGRDRRPRGRAPTNAWADGGGSDSSGDVVVKVKREPASMVARGEVRVEPDGRSLRTG